MADGPVHVTVLFSPGPRETREWPLVLPAGSTVADAIEASGLKAEFPGVDLAAMGVGVWGHEVGPGQALREQDRIEVYRPLKVDPKVARRQRFSKQGTRAAGLFARKR